MKPVQSVCWSDDRTAVRIIDQRALPHRVVERDLRSVDEVCEAIATLAVRGAPAIGVAAALGLVAALAPFARESLSLTRARLAEYAGRIRDTRPTAVNLPWAIERMLRAADAENAADSAGLLRRLREEATAILEEDKEMCDRIGEHGRSMLADGARILTHCNAGALATAGIGTALAPIYAATRGGCRLHVFVGETRPLLQGSRLTAWELSRSGIPVTVIVDGAAASLMGSGAIDLCIVGADRIAANGDVANKTGTYALAVLARHHRIPFYVAAPVSTFDPSTPAGSHVHIEERSPDEVRRSFDVVAAPDGVHVRNPAFDITPAELVTAFITDRGVLYPPYSFDHLPDARGTRVNGSTALSSAALP